MKQRVRSRKGQAIKVNVCEHEMEVQPGTTLFQLRDKVKPDADILVLNGAPANTDTPLSEGDSVAFIKRGEVPGAEELEALMAARHSPGVHEVVKNATVGIGGLGGLGSAVAVALVRIGIGKLILVDFDIVEPSNLNRQQYFVDQIGMLKVEALSQNLERINPYASLETHNVKLDKDNVPKIFDGVDVMVEAFDNPNAKAMIMQSFTAAFPEKPLVMASGMAGYASSNTIETKRVGNNIYVAGDLITAAAPGTGLMAPRVGVAAHHQANAVLRLLLNESMEDER